MSRSLAEEINACLWFILASIIVGLQGWGFFSVLITIKACFDTFAALYYAYLQIKQEN